MSVIGPAATAEHIDVREAPQQLGVLLAELGRVAGVQLSGVVDLCMAAARRICAYAAQTGQPVTALQSIGEMRRVGAIEHVVGGSLFRPGVNRIDCVLQAVAVGSLPSVSTVACMRMRCARREQRVKDPVSAKLETQLLRFLR